MHPRLRLHAAGRLHRRHLLVDLHRQPDRALLRAWSGSRARAARTALSRPRDASGGGAAGRRASLTPQSARCAAERGVSPAARRGCCVSAPGVATAAATRPPPSSTRGWREHLRSPMLFRDMAARGRARRRRAASAASASASTATTTSTASAAAPSWCASCAPSAHEPLLYIPHRLRDGYGRQRARRAAPRRRPARG